MNAAGQGVLLPETSVEHQAQRLEQVFAACFYERDNTLLKGGFDEPLYLPAEEGRPVCELRYREDFFASALHEAAHWCIAGPARRKRIDFAYWYTPDGRSKSQQQAFENVEFKPQALEWLFSRACDYRFRVSVDNLNGSPGEISDSDAFEERVVEQARHWCSCGLPGDGAIFFNALCREFDTPGDLNALRLSPSDLRGASRLA